MVKILVDLTEEEAKIVEVYKIVNRLKSKQEAVKQIIRYFDVQIKPKHVSKDHDFYKKTLKF